MANIVNITPLIDGERVKVYHVYLKSDGASGDLENFVLLDPEDFGKDPVPSYKIMEMTFHFAGFDANIGFDTGLMTKELIWVLPEGSDSQVKFNKFGGLTDRSNSFDGTGKLLLSTTGFTSSTDQGSMLIKVLVKS